MANVPQPVDFFDGHQMPSDGMLAAIGRLAILTASIEDILHELAWKYLKVPRQMGSLITQEKKLKRLTQDIIKIVRVAKVNGMVVDDLVDIFADLEKSAELRNKCVHWIWEPLKNGSHRLSPPAYLRNKEPMVCSVEDIKTVGDSLIWIEYRLRSHVMTIRELYKEIRKEGVANVPAPWLYIFPQKE